MVGEKLLATHTLKRRSRSQACGGCAAINLEKVWGQLFILLFAFRQRSCMRKWNSISILSLHSPFSSILPHPAGKKGSPCVLYNLFFILSHSSYLSPSFLTTASVAHKRHLPFCYGPQVSSVEWTLCDYFFPFQTGDYFTNRSTLPKFHYDNWRNNPLLYFYHANCSCRCSATLFLCQTVIRNQITWFMMWLEQDHMRFVLWKAGLGF